LAGQDEYNSETGGGEVRKEVIDTGTEDLTTWKRLAAIFAELTGVFSTVHEIFQPVRNRYQHKLASKIDNKQTKQLPVIGSI
jgi:hypothetical protein